MAPPVKIPSVFCRFLTATFISAYFSIHPKNPTTHIQKTLPAPPSDIARATPVMEPIPTVPPKAVDKAIAAEIPPPADFFISFIAVENTSDIPVN